LHELKAARFKQILSRWICVWIKCPIGESDAGSRVLTRKIMRIGDLIKPNILMERIKTLTTPLRQHGFIAGTLTSA